MRRSIAISALASALLLPATAASAQENPFTSCQVSDSMFSLGIGSEAIDGRPGAERVRATGQVSVTCNDMTLLADELVYDTDTLEVFVTGNVSMQQPDLSIYAERAVLDGRTKFGTFYNATGMATVGSEPTTRSTFGTMEPDVMFHGAEIARTAPQTYQIRDGGFTSCVQATPRWEMTISSATITLDKHALLRNVMLRVKDVPLLYIPVMYYPINKEDRATGFLLPTYGSSTIQGSSISNAFFLALGRSQDATFYHDWFSQTGQGVGSEYRYVASPTSRGHMEFYMLDERDQLAGDGVTLDRAARRSYRLQGDANQALPAGFRLYGRVNYFTDASTQQLSQSIYDSSRRDRSFNATLAGNIGRYRLTATYDQRDVFYGTEQGQRYGRAPSVSVVAGETPIGRSRVYVGGSGDATYLVRQNDLFDPETDQSLWRFDGGPTIRAPLSTLPWLTATGSASWRLTRWLETIDRETGDQVSVALTRQLLDMQARVVGPVLSRVFLTPDNGYATGFKHLIEPGFTVRRTTRFDEFDRVVRNDYSVDGLIGGTTSVNYRLTNRLLARRAGPPTPPGTPPSPGLIREILAVEIQQTYYTTALAASADQQYQSNGTISGGSEGTFSPVQIRATSRPTDGATAEFSMEIDSKYRAIRTLRASGTLDASRAQVTVGWTKRRTIEGHPQFSGPGDHFLNGSTTIRTAGNRLGGTYHFYVDVGNRTFVQQRVLAYYNTQCCGVSFDFQKISTPLYRSIPTDTRFGVSFTLAGIGSFSNPMGSFGGR